MCNLEISMTVCSFVLIQTQMTFLKILLNLISLQVYINHKMLKYLKWNWPTLDRYLIFKRRMICTTKIIYLANKSKSFCNIAFLFSFQSVNPNSFYTRGRLIKEYLWAFNLNGAFIPIILYHSVVWWRSCTTTCIIDRTLWG